MGAVVAVERFSELSLVGLLGSGLLALAGCGLLDPISLGLCAAGLVLRILRVSGVVEPRLPWPLVAVLAAAGLALGVADWLLLSKAWTASALHLGFFFTSAGILAARPGRDQGWLALGALLALLAASWWSTKLYFIGALAAFLLFGVAAFASAELRRSASQPGQVVRAPGRRLSWRLGVLSVLVAAGILVLTGGLFFVLPRTAQVAFRRLAPERFQLPGFSDQVTLGQLSRLRRHEAPLLRVRFYGERPVEPLKWRGNALERFDGRRWWNTPDPGERLAASEGMVKLAENRQLWRTGRRILYEVRLGNLASDTLYLAGTPEFLRINAPAVVRTASGGYRLGSGAAEGLRYGAYSFLEPGRRPEAEPGGPSAGTPSCCLELPSLDPRIAELSRQVTAGLGSAEARAEALEQHFRRRYAYRERSVSDYASDPLADFLFRSRQGHCEYFASALAVMLRLVGIPARVVTGFHGGVYNPVSGWQVVRASDAHSWVEAWVPGRGWTSFDPTPPQSARAEPSAWTRLNWYLDAAETFWDEWVLHYDLSRQLFLASKMESSSRDLSTHGMDRLRAQASQLLANLTGWSRRHGLAALAGLALAAAAFVAVPRIRAHFRSRRRLRQAARGEAQPSDATLLYERMLSVLKKRGFQRLAWQTPAEFAGVLPASTLASLVKEFTRAYNELRFGGQPSAAARLAVLLARIREAPGASGL